MKYEPGMKLHVEINPSVSADDVEKIRTVEALMNEAIRLGFLNPDKNGNFEEKELMRFISTLERIKS